MMARKTLGHAAPVEKTEIKQRGIAQSVETPSRYQAIRDISARFSLDRADIKYIFGISERTQFRYKKTNPVLNPAIADPLARFQRITQQAMELFEDEAEAQRWLSTPKAALDHQTPLSVLATDAGAKKVEQILYRAEYGMFG